LAQGRTVIRGAGELRLKEVDRIRNTLTELSRFEVKVEELPDGAIIYGGERLKAAECRSHGDHRLAMLLGVAGMVASGETEIHGASAVSISYPRFWDDASSICLT
jgi:3-phosphoshikimate 1-carboxyvinyltransferase